MRLAALDLGTNTFRLLIADLEGGRVNVLAREQTITRLGGGYDHKSGRISKEAIGRSVRALKKFAQTINDLKPERTFAAATEIVRRAKNGEKFLEEVRRQTGIDIEIIAPEREAALAFRGISAYLPQDMESPYVTLDVGGGSTEWAAGDASGSLMGWVSVPLGVVEIAERTITGDPPTAGSLECAERQVWEAVEDVPAKLDIEAPVRCVVGTGGTATSLAVLDLGLDHYDLDRVQNYRMSAGRVEEIEAWLNGLTLAEKTKLFPLRGGREDLIVPGALITRITLKRFGASELVVSDAGLLEGLLLAAQSD